MIYLIITTLAIIIAIYVYKEINSDYEVNYNKKHDKRKSNFYSRIKTK
jgi:hypothetical protein